VSVVKQPVVGGWCVLVALQAQHLAIDEPWFLLPLIGPDNLTEPRSSLALQADVHAQRLGSVPDTLCTNCGTWWDLTGTTAQEA